MKVVKYEGILPALVTPLCEDGKTVCVDSVNKLVELHMQQGADGFYPLGGTGQGLFMSREAREVMCEATVKAVAGRKPVITHVAAANFHEMIELAKHAERAGSDAIAAVPPVVSSYAEENIYNYYKTLADSVHIPLIIYHHPSCSGMSANLAARLFQVDNITGIKWSINNYFGMMELKDKTHGEMNIINGPDEMLICGLASGADAGIGTTYNVLLPEFKALYAHFRKGEIDEARALQFRINEVIRIMFRYEMIPAIKDMLTAMDIPCGDAAYPAVHFGPEQRAAYAKDLWDAGWDFYR